MAKTMKVAASMVVVCMLVMLGSLSARADEITLGGSGTTPVFSFGSGPTPIAVTVLTSCGATTACFEGAAIDLLGNSGTYELDANGVTIQLTGTAPQYTVTQSAPISFSFVNGATTYLTGNLELDSLGVVGSTGNFNDDLVGNLQITGGTLDSLFPSGILGLTIDLPSGKTIGTGTVDATLSSGEINAPEPASLSLFGIGLLGFAFLFRKRIRALA